jgi:hypothetical protein
MEEVVLKAMVGRCQEVGLASKHEVYMWYTCFYHKITLLQSVTHEFALATFHGLALVHTLG